MQLFCSQVSGQPSSVYFALISAEVEPLVFVGEVESTVFVKVAVADHGSRGEYGTYAGVVDPSEGIEA